MCKIFEDASFWVDLIYACKTNNVYNNKLGSKVYDVKNLPEAKKCNWIKQILVMLFWFTYE